MRTKKTSKFPTIKRNKKTGLAPGTIVFTGNQKVEKVLIHYMKYNNEILEEIEIDSHNEVHLPVSPKDRVDWYDVRGMHDTELIEVFGKAFNIHPLVLEDTIDINQRPTFDVYTDGIFLSLRAITFDRETLEVRKEHVAMYFYEGFLISFQESESDLFASVRKRLTSSSGRIRQRGSDYLAYALADSIVDDYYVALEEMEIVIEDLEEKMMDELDIKDKSSIHTLRKELLVLRKSVAPLREAVGHFSKTDSPFVQEDSQMYIRDLYEHTVQVVDAVESYRDILNGLQDLFLSEVSFKMNQVMQLLTLISVIFIPITFLAGLYGMNFDNIPELHHENGYHILLIVMAVIATVLFILFKRKKWM